MKPTLVIGDVHGHLGRLQALLLQEGVIEECADSGYCRTGLDAEVVQLGDLGQYDYESRDKDRSTWTNALPWLDRVLWGNHDRAVVDPNHYFTGYHEPFAETVDLIKAARNEGKLTLAYSAHDNLFTHAGVHVAFKNQQVEKVLKRDPELLAEWINNCELHGSEDPQFLAVRDAVGSYRGGASPHGGILWRDSREKLYDGFCQVFGHTSKDKVRVYPNDYGASYCIDTGNKFNGRLAGLWLPEGRVVRVHVEEAPPPPRDGAIHVPHIPIDYRDF